MDRTPQDELRAWLLELYARYVADPGQPPDHFLGGFLRRHPVIRGKARNFLGAVFFSQLRRRPATLLLGGWDGMPSSEGRLLAPTHPPAEEAVHAMVHWMISDLAMEPGAIMEHLRTALDIAAEREERAGAPLMGWCPDLADQGKQFLLSTSNGADGVAPALADPLRASIPPALWERWKGRFGHERAMDLALALSRPAPLDIRVNIGVVPRETVLETLHKAGVEAGPTPYSPTGIRLRRKVNLAMTAGLEPSWWEVQDEGSQLVCLACGGGGRLLDACAGAGGKALAISSLFDGEVFAHDIDVERLSRLKPRAALAGGRPIVTLPPGKAATAAPYDVVLIDAPCMGLGRMRRDPTVAWRQPFRAGMEEITAAQDECLAQYAPLVRPGGFLVYATCSFEPEETEGRLTGLKGFAPALLPAPFDGEAFASTRSGDGSRVTLLPSLHETDGFFIGRLRRLS